MKKRLISLCLALAIFISLPVEAFAHDKEGLNGHDQFIEYLLFGDKTYKNKYTKTDDLYIKIASLEDAVALCADNSKDYAQYLTYLDKTTHVHGLPDSIDEIYYGANQYHRRDTHMGWNYDYTNGGASSDKANWTVRKEILRQTVNKVFGFQKMAGKWFSTDFDGEISIGSFEIDLPVEELEHDFGYTDQCDAFAALLYYDHLLADYDETKTASTAIGYLMPIAREHAGDNNEDIFYEIERILPLIFPEQSSGNSRVYSGLITDIKSLASEARSYVANTPDLKNNFTEYKTYAEKLRTKLESKIPALLKEEPFFSDVFYKSK